MKHKTCDLTGALLDQAVALVIGAKPRKHLVSVSFDDKPAKFAERFDPYSSNWALGGPIIERERIMILPLRENEWVAVHPRSMIATELCQLNATPGHGYVDFNDGDCEWRGPTPLIAAMLAYVASKLGDEVELP